MLLECRRISVELIEQHLGLIVMRQQHFKLQCARFLFQRSLPVCHVWTAPAMQEESDVSANGRVRSCIRPAVAATLAAGHDVIRGSGPNQGAALKKRMALSGFSQSNGSTVSHHVVFTPAIRECYVYMVYALLHR